jgi:murein DD-endopeptidase MepM/ murein hydrolase activator NlpD/archaellum component FlaC
MKRRSRLAVTLVALLTVGVSLVGTQPRGPAHASEPISQAKAQQQELERTVRQQEQRLADLRAAGAQLSTSLRIAETELEDLTAEYERVQGLLEQVKTQVAEIRSHIAELEEQIAELDAQLEVVAGEIVIQTRELEARETLLEDHLRSAYEKSQTSILEMLLSADSLEAASNQVGYLLVMSEQDKELAEEVRAMRQDLRQRRTTLADGRRAVDNARQAADEERANLEAREAELVDLEQRAAELKAAAAVKRAEQEALLNANLAEQGDVARTYEQNTAAMQAQQALVSRLVAEEQARQRQIEEARRRQAAEEEARRRAAAQRPAVSVGGFSWPLASFKVTQEFGPTSFALEPPYTFRGTYYQHFHTGIDISGGCGSPVMASREGVVVSSGQPLAPYDSAYGVIVDHGGGVQTWYWHLQPRVVVVPGSIVTSGQVIGYEGNTGFSTGCHVHFAVTIDGGFENPRFFLP